MAKKTPFWTGKSLYRKAQGERMTGVNAHL